MSGEYILYNTPLSFVLGSPRQLPSKLLSGKGRPREGVVVRWDGEEVTGGSGGGGLMSAICYIQWS